MWNIRRILSFLSFFQKQREYAISKLESYLWTMGRKIIVANLYLFVQKPYSYISALLKIPMCELCQLSYLPFSKSYHYREHINDTLNPMYGQYDKEYKTLEKGRSLRFGETHDIPTSVVTSLENVPPCHFIFLKRSLVSHSVMKKPFLSLPFTSSEENHLAFHRISKTKSFHFDS